MTNKFTLKLKIVPLLFQQFSPHTENQNSMIGYLQEKMKGIGGESMMTMMKETTQAKLKDMGAHEMIQNLQGKLKGIDGESIMRMKETTQAKLKEMAAHEMIQNLQEKLKGIDGESMTMMKETTQAKLKEMGEDGMIHNLVEKLKELLLILEDLGLYLMAWLDEVFPPETRKERIQHWIRVGAPYVLPVMVLLVLFWLCSRGKGIKMMKAPGRNFRMPRNAFEANPKGYFRSLRAEKLKF